MAGKQKLNSGLDDAPQLKPIGKSSGKGKGLNKYLQSNAVKAGAAGVLVLLLVVIIGWQLMSGDEGQSKSRAATASTDAAQTTSNPMPPPMPDTATTSAQPQSDPNAQNVTPPAQDQSNGTQPEQSQTDPTAQPADGRGADGRGTPTDPSALPALPEDVTKWGKADFARARQENNSKLLEAVMLLVEKSPGSVPVAQQLIDLLKPPKPPEGDLGYGRGPTGSAMPGLIESVVYALSKNDSQLARQTLKQILSGKLTTDDDRAAVEAVLKSLTQMPSPENNELLVKVLISPEAVRPPTNNPQSTWLPTELQSRAMELIKQDASESLCIKLAENLSQKGIEPNDPIAEMLLQDNPSYLGAQLVLYQSPDLMVEPKTKLEQYFMTYSSQAISLTMGIPFSTDGSTTMSIGTRGTAPSTGRDRERGRDGRGSSPLTGIPSAMPDTVREKVSDYEHGTHLAKQLWGEPLASLMLEYLGDVKTLEKSASGIVLASTLPLDSIHVAMFKMLKKRATQEGPQSLETVGWTDKVLADPGLLVLIKMLPRSKSARKPTVSGPGTGRYTPRGTNPGATLSEAAQKKEQIETEWMMTLSKMIDAWCTRLEAASQAQKKAIRRQQKVIEPTPTKLDDFEIPQDAKVIAAYQVNWPVNAPKDLGKIKPPTLKIQYFRLELSGMMKKSMANFKRLAKGGELHEMSNGLWLDLIKNGSQPNSKRSLDILITSADKQPVDLTILKEEEMDLEVDILAVEIVDPTKE